MLIAPSGAFAHGRSPALALDYRLRLGPAPAGVHVRIYDGDRSLEARVDPGTSLLVRGLLREPMLRFDADGVFANAASPTAQADRVATAGSGWHRVASGRAFAWHEHRLAPSGERGSFSIPVEVDGRSAAIAGGFRRVARPAVWPWLALAGAIVAVTALAVRVKALRVSLALVLALVAGAAALTATVAFALRDRPGGGVAWVTVVVAAGIACALAASLVRSRGRGRSQVAGVIGAIAFAVTIAALPVYWHGVVISALSAGSVRLLCDVALAAGACAAVVTLLPEPGA